MNMLRNAVVTTFASLFLAGNFAAAATTLNVSEMHLCCGACVKGVTSAVAELEGVSVTVDRKGNSIAIEAGDDTTAQQALDAIAAAGFHGTTDNAKLKMKDDSGVAKGKVSRLELTGIHNCCGGCNKAVKKAIASVDGVVADTAKPKQDSLVVEGNFDGQELVSALLKAGFHVRAKK